MLHFLQIIQEIPVFLTAAWWNFVQKSDLQWVLLQLGWVFSDSDCLHFWAAESWFHQEVKSSFVSAFQITKYQSLQFSLSSVDGTSIVLEIGSCKLRGFSETSGDSATRLADWEGMRDDGVSAWLKVMINDDNNTKICNEKMNSICERWDW